MTRAITVRQPWAWAIIHGGKDVENRTRTIAGAYRGPVAIHAGLAVDLTAVGDPTFAAAWHEAFMPEHNDARGIGWGNVPDLSGLADDDDTELPRGTIIGIVDLVDVHDGIGESRGDLCSPWAMRFHHHLVLANPRPLAVPIPYKGRLGLWTLPDGVLA